MDKIRKQAAEATHFLYSQAFADGLRATVSILLPALIGYYYNFFELGLTIALGAFCVSLTDEPGPFRYKRNGMIMCTAVIFITALVTSIARYELYTLGALILVVCFLYSMLTVFGHRISAVGSAGILIMILMMDEVIPPSQILPNSLSIALGGTWYMLISLFLYDLQPYRPAQRALGKCIREVATYLSVKSNFYNTKTKLEDDYSKLLSQQVVVNEQLESVRDLLFKTRQIVSETTRPGRKLVLTFVDTVDFFEETTAAYYDYAALRKRFETTGILEEVSGVIKIMADELDRTGIAIQRNSKRNYSGRIENELIELKKKIDNIPLPPGESNIVLKKILVNMRHLYERLNQINEYFESDRKRKGKMLDHSQFVSKDKLDVKRFTNNLTLRSTVFRHAIRVSIACLIGFIIGELIPYGQYSYWILLTIAFILKPAFSLTKRLNKERIIGTVIGGAVGMLILVFIPSKALQFSFLVFALLMSNVMMRGSYVFMVLFTTIYVVIFMSLLGTNFKSVVQERIIDTLIGGTIAFLASFILFPTWEVSRFKKHATNMLRANAEYLQKIIDALTGKKLSILEYKLARKQVYVHSANLAAAFQRMLSEPKSKQPHSKEIHQFVVLSHILFSNIATVATSLRSKETAIYSHELQQLAKNSWSSLMEAINEEAVLHPAQTTINPNVTVIEKEDPILKEQLLYINRICQDLKKSANKFISD